jgi:hypothetical protein
MKLTSSLSLAVALTILPASSLFAQEMTGVSHPQDVNTAATTADDSHYVKPSAGTPSTSDSPVLHQHADANAAAAPVVYGTYKPYVAPGSTPPPVQTAEVRSTSQPIVTDDPNSGVVIDVPSGENELPIGTVLKANLQDGISTKETAAGTKFTAVLNADIAHHGKVLVPSGTVIHGRVTEVRGGRHFGAAAAIHLQPDSLTLPDGTTYRLNAQVTDLDNYRESHVNAEGTIVNNSNAKATAAALGLTTGSAVVAGAMIGGGVGAVVGLGVGAGAGAVWWLRRDRQQTLPKGTEIVFMLDNSMQLGGS